MKKNFKSNRGFTFVELVVGVAVSLVIIIAVYNAYSTIFDVVYTSRAKIDAVDLLNEQMEIIRNMPYSEVGIVDGIPNGVLTHVQTVARGSSVFTLTTTVRNIDDPFDGLFPNDTSPADYKMVEIDADCALCKNFSTVEMTTLVAPKALETASTNGALFVQVFDANGVPIENASVHIENDSVTPPIVIDDVTNAQGMLQVVDVPPGVNAYQITVTKAGYSTDQTYGVTVQNPHPTKLPATVVLQQVTELSFAIDKVSTFSVSSLSNTCSPVPGVHFSLTGSKNIGTNPTVPKYSQSEVTDGNGLLTIPNMEWDSYTFSNTDSVYDFIGSSPISPISLAPNSTQNVELIVAPKNPKTELVTVSDAASGLPLSGVSVELTNGSGVDITQVTGQGFLGQTDWSGGGGQATSTDPTKYFSSDGNVEIDNPAGSITLKKVLGQYVPSGQLVSSTFDTGAQSNFQQLNWNPTNQPAGATVNFQVASNNDGATWNFTGPDGTANTYYTTANQNISATNNGNRYFRYEVFLGTSATSTAPSVSNISFTFTLSCTPPGQVYFSGLSGGSYNLAVSKSGYVTQNIPVTVSSNWQALNVTMQSQ
jgi:competence protein ComGC